VRILYFGDSHLGALWRAAREEAVCPSGFKEVFFAATIPHLRKNTFSIINGHLVPTNPKIRETFQATGGAETIDLGQFDACVVVSYASHGMHILRLISNKIAHVPAHLYTPGNFFDLLISDSVYRSYLSQGLVNLAEMNSILGKSFPHRTIYVQRPMMSQNLPLHRAAKRDDSIDLKQQFYFDMQDVFRAEIENLGAYFVGQPESTLLPDRSTKNQYSINSQAILMDRSHPENDCAHMNSAYGLLALKDIRAQLEMLEQL
jgi:hypothetical protein